MSSTPITPSTPITSVATDSFAPWLAASGGSLIVTCYQANRIALLGSTDGRETTVHLREFPRPMGLAVSGSRIAVGLLEEVMLMQNAPQLVAEAFPAEPSKYDALYLPRVSYRTGEIAVHGLVFGKAGLWMANTRFSCLASLSDEYHFVPQWQPPFITDLAPEDRCHLNGMAMVDGEPRFVTCLGTTDVAGAWRQDRVTGGVIVSVPDGRIVSRGLTMPHSPRWHEGRLWVLNSGQGELALVEPDGSLTTICTLPGYLRGLCFLGHYAVVGMCQIRSAHTFAGLPISQKYDELYCGLAVIDLRTKQPVAMFRFTTGCTEIFEVDFLPGVRRGAMLNNEHEVVKVSYTAPGRAWWNH